MDLKDFPKFDKNKNIHSQFTTWKESFLAHIDLAGVGAVLKDDFVLPDDPNVQASYLPMLETVMAGILTIIPWYGRGKYH